jgi:hypothetical protein
MLLPIRILSSYSVLPCQDGLLIAKCFTKSNKRFRWEVMLENEHTFCSWIHVFAPAQLLRKLSELQSNDHGDLDSSVTGDVGTVCPRGGTASDFIFVSLCVTVVGLRFKWYTLQKVGMILAVTSYVIRPIAIAMDVSIQGTAWRTRH